MSPFPCPIESLNERGTLPYGIHAQARGGRPPRRTEAPGLRTLGITCRVGISGLNGGSLAPLPWTMSFVLRLFLSVYHFVLHHMMDRVRKMTAGLRGPYTTNAQGTPRNTRHRHPPDSSDFVAFEAALQAKDRELHRRMKELEEVQKELGAEKEGAKMWREKFDSADANVQQLQVRLREMEAQIKSTSARLTEQQRVNAHLEKERRVTTTILETRTAELKEAQAFLTKADDVADSELLRMIDALNAKIFQTAASLAEAPQFRYGNEDVSAAEHAAQKLEHDGWLGPHILSALRTIDHTRDTVLVQTALQASMGMYVRWLATSWNLGRYDPEELLPRLYAEVRQRGTYPTMSMQVNV